jgi:large-conductance mechanosensitive channel
MALVASFLLPLVGVICGHVALAQVRRTGESGRGLAIAALIIGYAALAVTAIAVTVTMISIFIATPLPSVHQ